MTAVVIPISLVVALLCIRYARRKRRARSERIKAERRVAILRLLHQICELLSPFDPNEYAISGFVKEAYSIVGILPTRGGYIQLGRAKSPSGAVSYSVCTSGIDGIDPLSVDLPSSDDLGGWYLQPMQDIFDLLPSALDPSPPKPPAVDPPNLLERRAFQEALTLSHLN